MNVFSFDIFDTCLVRTCGNSDYVFDLLAERILGKSPRTQKMDFTFIRKKGEERARIKFLNHDCEEVTLKQIYECCDFSMVTDLDKRTILQLELEIEHSVLVSVYNIKELISKLRQEGNRILFISDMYLPTSFLKKILMEHAIMSPQDVLFVSSEIKKTKKTGNLFRYVHDILGISYKVWTHFGDNHTSDGTIPRKLGIKTQRVYHSYSVYEKTLLRKEYEGGKMNIHLMASISKAIRINLPSSPQTSVATDFIAPIFVPFVYSVLADAQKQGITGMYFLARDGYIFYKIAEKLLVDFSNIKIHYLYVSRKALYLPSIVDITYESIKERLAYIDNCTISDVLDRFQLEDYFKNYEQYSTLLGEALIDSLLKDKHFMTQLVHKRDEQRRYCLEYFKQEGLTEGKNAIIDLSGSRRCHVAINEILAHQKNTPVFGYYFDVLNSRIPGKDYYASLFSERAKFNPKVSKTPQAVFEQYFCITDHDSTIGYTLKDNIVIPILGNERVDKTLREKTFELNSSVCQQYAASYLKMVDLSKSEEFIGPALATFNTFNYAPSPYYIKAFLNLFAASSTHYEKPFIEKCNILRCLKNRHSLWFYPNLVYNSRFSKLVYYLLYVRYLIKEYFFKYA